MAEAEFYNPAHLSLAAGQIPSFLGSGIPWGGRTGTVAGVPELSVTWSHPLASRAIWGLESKTNTYCFAPPRNATGPGSSRPRPPAPLSTRPRTALCKNAGVARLLPPAGKGSLYGFGGSSDKPGWMKAARDRNNVGGSPPH